MSTLKPDDKVWYYPSSGGPCFAAVVDSDSWWLGEHTLVVRLRDLGDDYCEYTGRSRRTVPCAAVDNVKKREYDHKS